MKEIFPNYYHKFSCIADRCKHSCCIGWEIDIDDETMVLYNSLEGVFAEKIRENITGDPPQFALNSDGHCPFLNKKGLCDIILKLGDGALCDICYLHPRFSNFYEDFTETGIGLCCEEAARIILTETEKFSMELPESAKNKPFFRERNEVFAILQDRTVSMFDRFRKLAKKYGLKFNFCNRELYGLYESLERLDRTWEQALEKLKNARGTDIFERPSMQIFFEQLSCYLTFRRFEKGVEFILLSCWVLGAICSACENIEEMLDVARMYSSEIEYSDENITKITAFFSEGVLL